MSRDFQYIRINGDFVWHAVLDAMSTETRCGQKVTAKNTTEKWAEQDAPSYQCLHCFPVGKKP